MCYKSQFTAPQRAWQAHSLSDRPARTAQAYLKSYWNQQLPVDPIAITNAVGVQVFANRPLKAWPDASASTTH